MTYITIGAGCAIIIIMALFILVFPNSYLGLRIVFAIVLILLLVSIAFGWKNQKSTFRMYSEFMSYATEMASA